MSTTMNSSFSFTYNNDEVKSSPKCASNRPTTSTPHSAYRPRVNFHSIESILNTPSTSVSNSRHDDTGYESWCSPTTSTQQLIIERSKQRKPRRKFNDWQNWYLRQIYNQNRYPSSEEYDTIAQKLELPTSSIRIWFQNHRARHGKN